MFAKPLKQKRKSCILIISCENIACNSVITGKVSLVRYIRYYLLCIRVEFYYNIHDGGLRCEICVMYVLDDVTETDSKEVELVLDNEKCIPSAYFN